MTESDKISKIATIISATAASLSIIVGIWVTIYQDNARQKSIKLKNSFELINSYTGGKFAKSHDEAEIAWELILIDLARRQVSNSQKINYKDFFVIRSGK